MSKPSIQNVTTTQTFQNWLDKTNEMVDLFRDSAVTASVSGDTTTGDATLLGEFTANNVVAWDELRVDNMTARTAGGNITSDSPVVIVGALDPVVATFNYGASGGRTRYTNGAFNWDLGIDNSTDTNFTMRTAAGVQLTLSPNGILTVPAIVTSTNITIAGSVDAANVSVSDTLTANNATITNLTCNNIKGNLYGDVYTPDGVKVFENGPGGGLPATFTGNVLGTVSSLTNHSTDSLKEGGTNLYYTNSRARAAISAGTGVSYNDVTGIVSIGQAVGTNSDVSFKSVTATGNITAFFGTTSDIRTKENIEPITGALDKVSKLGGYTFNYKGKDERMAGVIAQELVEVLPEAVFETKDPNTGEDIYAVRYDNIIGLLIEAIKELQEKVGK